jgi:hypothetical protein
MILPTTPMSSLETIIPLRSLSPERKKNEPTTKEKNQNDGLTPKNRVEDHENTWENSLNPENDNRTLSPTSPRSPSLSPKSPRLSKYFNKTPNSPKPSKEEKIKIKEEKAKVKKVKVLKEELTKINLKINKLNPNENEKDKIKYESLEKKQKEVLDALELLSPRLVSVQKNTNNPVTSTTSIISPLTADTETDMTTDNLTDEKKTVHFTEDK